MVDMADKGTDAGDKGTDVAYGPRGRGFYGSVTVGARGQVALPAQARRDLGIEPGDKLLVLGDPKQGLALVSVESLLQNLDDSSHLLGLIRRADSDAADPSAE